MAGDNITIGDFAAAAVVFSYVYNDALAGGADYTDKGKKVLEGFPTFMKWVENIRGELADYLQNRPPAPF